MREAAARSRLRIEVPLPISAPEGSGTTLALVVDFYFWRPDDLRASFPTRFDRHVIFALALLATAGVIAYLVDRLRTLSTYYGQKL
jgi:putative copper export protein